MSRAEYKRLSTWCRTNQGSPYDGAFARAELERRKEEARRQLGWYRDSEFGRWLRMCRNRRMYLIQSIADRKHSERVAAMDWSDYRRAA